MKKVFIYTLCFLFLKTTVQAQITHAISINGKAYGNFFNPEKEKFGAYNKDKYSMQVIDATIPRINYTIGKNRSAVEFYYSHNSSYYNSIPTWTEDQLERIEMISFGMNFHYQYWSNKFIKLNALAGVNYNLFNYQYNLGIENCIPKGNKGNIVGIQVGQSVQVPICHGFFANATARYNINPFTNDVFLRNNLLVEVGFGYSWNRKKQ